MRQSILLSTSAQDRSSPAHHVQTISRVPAYLNLHFLFGNPHVRQGKRLQAERERAGNGCVRRGRIRPPPRAPQRLQPGCSAPSRLPSPAPGRCHSGHVGSCPTRGKHPLCAVRAARLLRAPARCQCCRAVGSPGPARPGEQRLAGAAAPHANLENLAVARVGRKSLQLVSSDFQHRRS